MKNTPHSPELAPFDLAAFVAQFPLFARAPNGIANLRALILQLAVQGKLVPQDPNDEPASASLEKIAAEREQLIKTGKIKKEKPLPMIADDEKLFELPEKWVWVRLASILSISSGKNLTSSQMNPKGEIPVFGGNGITGYHDQSNIFKPTLVIGRVGFYCGSIHITPDKAWITDNAFITYFSEENIDLVFLSWLLKSKNLNENDSATAQPVISGRKVYPIVVALPPLEEQQRIVAKVDELMALCDQLEAQQDDQARNLLEANTAAVQAVTAFSSKTLTPQPPLPEVEGEQELISLSPSTSGRGVGVRVFDQHWQRIATHFTTLYGTNLPLPSDMRRGKLKDRTVALENVAKLRELILGLACSGSLSYGLRKDIPDNWQWTKIKNLANHVTSGSRGWKKYYATSGATFIRSQDIKYDKLYFEDQAYVDLPDSAEGQRTRVYSGDLLITITGANVGKVAHIDIAPTEAYVSQHVCLLRLEDPKIAPYLHLWLKANYGGRGYLLKESYGDKPGLNLDHIKNVPVPFPPLEEQHRIVAQVDELMALCDTLETLLTEQRQVAADFSAAAVLAVTA